jgi:hypothetical protein
MRHRRALVWIVVLALFAAVPLVLSAQRRRGFGGMFGYLPPNAEYDGRYTFARIRYTSDGSWTADWPTMEQNLTAMLQELTSLNPNVDQTNVHTLDDPELMKYPVAYLTEPGYWVPSDEEVLGLRNYLDKGGFLIVDDFFDPGFHFGREWSTFERAMWRVLPEAQLFTLEVSNPVFNTFFNIQSLAVPYPGRYGEAGLMGEFYGLYEDNDPSKRLMVVINYNIDLGDYVEWAQSSRAYSFEPTNEAYKFMINYVVYGLTH